MKFKDLIYEVKIPREKKRELDKDLRKLYKDKERYWNINSTVCRKGIAELENLDSDHFKVDINAYDIACVVYSLSLILCKRLGEGA